MALTKIGSIGINTGIAFAGVTTIATLNASDNVLSVGGTVNFVSDVSIGGTVSIAGTLTYEDVTNVDAVGLITARDGIKVGSGITLSVDGDIFATGVSTATKFVGDGSELTGVASTENIRTNTNATFLQNINVGVAITAGKLGIGFTDNNVKVGSGAADALTTGGNNTAVGNNALTANTTGGSNTAVGNDALGANTTGGVNVAVGSLALDANTTASQNTAVGYAALGANTT